MEIENRNDTYGTWYAVELPEKACFVFEFLVHL
jgi:hypothetical protein